MANYINKYLNQSAYDADDTKQYPNTSLVGSDVVYAATVPAPVDDSDVSMTISVSANNTQIQLWPTIEYAEYEGAQPVTVILNPSDKLDYIKVDDTEISLSTLYAADNIHTFAQGTHTIKYKVLWETEGNDSYPLVAGVDYFVLNTDNNTFTITNFETREIIETLSYGLLDEGQIVDYNGLSVNGNVVFDNVMYINAMYDENQGSFIPSLACTGNLTLKYNEEVSVDVGEQDEPILPIYTNLYVPSSLVSAYQTTGWTNVNAIQTA